MFQPTGPGGRSSTSLLALCAMGPRERPAPGTRSVLLVLFLLLLVSPGSSAVITGACEMDSQCGGAMCCAVSVWIRTLRMCTPMGQEHDDCHPMSHKIPFKGMRLHHTCPCLPNLACITPEDGRSRCLPAFKFPDYYL
ncbi:prokineticin-2 [Gadus chalcogrammus]|uniref:prokineticin-2 n=1 Tax=Gadus chalcogrammus TaxID=1042646 RepID=UPI0024C4BC37|nr:prokineticin-2 [Gadus chalcogrammus]